MPTISPIPNVDIPDNFLQSQLITYIGNKRALLEPILIAIQRIEALEGNRPLRMMDMFSGSGVVARLMKLRASFVWANDIEYYSGVINQCFLTNPSEIDEEVLDYWHQAVLAHLNENLVEDGFIRSMYSPLDERNIKQSDRVFYTAENANIIDTCAPFLQNIPKPYSNLLLGPFLSACSRHVNTSGVFKGFYKNKEGVGQFGGTMKNALSRILKRIEIEKPILAETPCDHLVTAMSAEKLSNVMDDVDVAYLDPPYNQHPYGSNYFMLNAIAGYKKPADISRVSGIPADWNRSAFNRRKDALEAMKLCVSQIKAKYLIISYNSEGFISISDMQALLDSFGTTEVMSTKYPTFRGCRNLKNREPSVTEFIFLLRKEH